MALQLTRLGCGLAAICVTWAAAAAPLAPQTEASTWHEGAGYRWAQQRTPPKGEPGFTLLSPGQTGLAFTNLLFEFSGATNRILFNGAGVALGDYDGDGRIDIFVCGLDVPSALFRNLGDWRFTNTTTEAGLQFTSSYQRGAVFADIDGDGALDLLVSTLNQGVLCFHNDGKGHFKNVTQTAATETHFGSVTMALADIDGNGTLDLYVANNRGEDIRNRGSVQLQMRNGQYVIPQQFSNRLVVVNGAVREFGEPDLLYLNDGHGHFTACSWTDGRFLDEQGIPLKQPPLDWGQTVTFRDLNGDGLPDIYVCNDYWTVDRIWLNNGQGSFRAINREAIRHVCFSSMGVDMADIDRDGNLDIFVTDMQSRDPRMRKRQMFAFNPKMPLFNPMAPPLDFVPDRPQIMRNTLFLNRGDQTYADIADFAGLASAEWAWQQLFLDVDLDGYEDLIISAGYFRDVQDKDALAAINARKTSFGSITNEVARHLAFCLEKMTNARLYPPYECPLLAFRNLGDMRFKETTAAWGTGQGGIRQGIAAGDLDQDGDMDLVVNSFNGPLEVYRNNSSAPRVTVRLRGLPPNTQGIGAKIRFWGGAVPMQSQEIVCGGRYLSGSEPAITFATGSAQDGMRLEVDWRSGKRSTIRDIVPNLIYEIEEKGATEKSPIEPPPVERPLFKDSSGNLEHTHHEEAFDDFIRQPLLPRKLSHLGPGTACWDVNQDGHEDLLITAGKGGELGLYLGDGQGKFSHSDFSAKSALNFRDETCVLGYSPSAGQSRLLIASASYEDGLSEGAAVSLYNWNSNSLDTLANASVSSVGPMVLGDIDGDGYLDLVIGGRVKGGRWPEPADSLVYRNEAGKFVLDAQNTKLLQQAGLVSAAVLSDLDGDGLPELILACEWGPIRVFHNAKGIFSPWNIPLIASNTFPQSQVTNLSQLSGWWNGVATGDLDGDGRLDIVAANWGFNTPYQASLEHPLEIYYGDLGGLGLVDIIEAEFEAQLGATAPRRNREALLGSLPYLAAKFPNHKSFSEATLEATLGEALPRAKMLQTTALASTAFLNRGDHFEVVALPREAQFSPAFAVVIADFDGDGFEDVFLSQNFFEYEPSIPRSDAGRGLLLLGNGQGGLRATTGQDSGIKIYGEQRGAAAADFNEDGRTDLVVTQNSGKTRLFENVRANPGLRIRLHGPETNPRGIGAVLRLKSEHGYGPAREIRGGGGYCSQDSPVTVMGLNEKPTQLSIRWPGGKKTDSTLPKNAREVEVDFSGQVRVLKTFE